MALDPVILGGPHVSAHNEERSSINLLLDMVSTGRLSVETLNNMTFFSTTSKILSEDLTVGINTSPIPNRTIKVNDLVISSHPESNGVLGRVVTASGTSVVTVSYVGDLEGPQGPESPYIYIGPDEPDHNVYTIWIDTSGGSG